MLRHIMFGIHTASVRCTKIATAPSRTQSIAGQMWTTSTTTNRHTKSKDNNKLHSARLSENTRTRYTSTGALSGVDHLVALTHTA
jgi:hypothetical protein